MAKVTVAQVRERFDALLERAAERRAKSKHNLQILNPELEPIDATYVADEVAYKAARSIAGDRMYHMIEAGALQARDDLARALLCCGVNVTDEAYDMLAHVTLGLELDAAAAALAYIQVEAALA